MVRRGSGRRAMSRGRRRAVFVAVGLVLVLLGVADQRLGGPIREAVSWWGPDWGDWRTYAGGTFRVVRVVDGDTFDVDQPDGRFEHTRVRLMGVDTPEKGGPGGAMHFGAEATEFTRGLVEGRDVVLHLDAVGDVRGKYGRLLAYVELEDGTILNERLIREGYGYADLRFPHSRREAYVAMQEEAVAAGAGLWEEAARADLPKWLQQERPEILRR